MIRGSVVRILRAVLAWAARRYLRRGSAYVIGVTGSVGKTSCRQAIVAVLRTMLPDYSVATPAGNFNGEIGLPLGVLGISSYEPTPWSIIRTLWIALRKGLSGKPTYDILVLEYGIDRPGEMAHMLRICTPQIGVLTAIDGVHAANFDSFEQLQQNKQQLITASTDCVFVPSGLMTNTLRQEIRADWFSYGSDDAIVRISERQDESDTREVSVGLVVHDVPLVRLRTDAFDEIVYDYLAIGAVIADVIAMRYDGCSLFPCLETPFVSLPPVRGRGQILDGIQESVLIDQTYNAAPKSMRAALAGAVSYRDRFVDGASMLCILGDMRELGDMSTAEHIELAGIVEPYIDEGMVVIFVGKETSTTADALGVTRSIWGDETVLPGVRVGEHQTGRVYHVVSSTEAGMLARAIVMTHPDQQYVVMAKGSQNTIYTEEALAYLLASAEDSDRLPRQSRTRRRTKAQRFAQAGAPMMASSVDLSSLGGALGAVGSSSVSNHNQQDDDVTTEDERTIHHEQQERADETIETSMDETTADTADESETTKPSDDLMTPDTSVDASSSTLIQNTKPTTGVIMHPVDIRDDVVHTDDKISDPVDEDDDTSTPSRQLFRPAEWQIDSDDPMIV